MLYPQKGTRSPSVVGTERQQFDSRFTSAASASTKPVIDTGTTSSNRSPTSGASTPQQPAVVQAHSSPAAVPASSSM